MEPVAVPNAADVGGHRARVGADQYVLVPHDPAISFGGEDFTIEAYVKLAEAKKDPQVQFLAFKKPLKTEDYETDYGFLVQAGVSGSGGYGRSGGELALLLGDGEHNLTVVSGLEITDANWHYVAVLFDSKACEVQFRLDDASDLQQSWKLGTVTHFDKAGGGE